MDLYMKYTGMTMEQMREQMKPQAVKRIETRLVLEAVVKAENIQASDDKPGNHCTHKPVIMKS